MSADAEQRQVVVLVHGIRDYALWQNRIRSELNAAGFIAEPLNYGRFGLLQFLVPVPYFRRWAIKQVSEEIRIVKQKYPGARLSIIAHSFGTYIIAALIKKTFDLNASRIIFCGSVVSYLFRFQDYQFRFIDPILNEVGTRDIWPAIAQSVTWGYGSTGSYGFRRPLVRDRWHNGAGHAFFLKSGFCSEFWVPYLKDGTIVEAALDPEPPRLWLRVLSVLKIKYLAIIVLAYGLYPHALPFYKNALRDLFPTASTEVLPGQTWSWPKSQAVCLEANERWNAASCEDRNGNYIVANSPWVDTDHGLNVRAGVGTSERVIGLFPPNLTQIARGSCSKDQGTGADWCEVSCKAKNLNGYVANKYIKLQSEALTKTIGVAASDELAIKNGPFPTCNNVGSIPYNATDIVTHICQTSPVGTSTWCLITYQAISGWVPSAHLQPQPPN
jgi:hypothetical protein